MLTNALTFSATQVILDQLSLAERTSGQGKVQPVTEVERLILFQLLDYIQEDLSLFIFSQND